MLLDYAKPKGFVANRAELLKDKDKEARALTASAVLTCLLCTQDEYRRSVSSGSLKEGKHAAVGIFGPVVYKNCAAFLQGRFYFGNTRCKFLLCVRRFVATLPWTTANGARSGLAQEITLT